MKVGILQAGDTPDELIEEFGGYGDMCMALLTEQAKFDYEVYRVFDGIFPAAVDECDAWLITGSRFGVYEDHAWIPPLKALIRDIEAKKIPLVGICFGHQIIAEALGGKAGKSDKGWGLGLDRYNLNESGPHKPNGEQVILNIFHQDQVTLLPPKAVNFASSDFCALAGFKIGNHVLTVQAHPEFKPGYENALLPLRREKINDDACIEKALVGLKNNQKPADSQLFGRWISDFLQGV